MRDTAQAGAPSARVAETAPEELIEPLFFAYRDFVGDADARLQHYAFGRAHHRVLHFVNRRPGLTVAELLDILRITKQSLSRVLRDVIEAGFVEARPGVSDRRQRLLYTTDRGRALSQELTQLQSARIARALRPLESGERAAVARFLRSMIDAETESEARWPRRDDDAQTRGDAA